MQPPQYPRQSPSSHQQGHPASRSSRRSCLVVALIFAGLLVCGYFASKAALASLTPNKQGEVTPTPPVTQVASQSGRTPTPSPTPKPRKGPSRAQLDDLIAPAYPPITIESYQQSTGTLIVSISYGERVNWDQYVLKKAMADTQATFWEQQNWYFSSITVNVYELLFAGGQRKMAYGVLTSSTAQTVNFQWGLYGDLWDKYDKKWLDSRVPSE